MKTKRTELIVLTAGIALLALLAYGRQEASQPSVFSTYDTGPNGYRAIYGVLRTAGVDVRRFRHPLGLLDRRVRTLVISGYEGDPSAQGLDAHDAAALRRFVTGGGRLVVLDASFAGSRDFTPGVATSVAAQARGATAVARDRYTAGVERVRAPIGAVFPARSHRGAPLLANAHGIVAIAYRLGRGEVVAVTAPALFANAYLRNAGNAAFAYDAIAGHGPAAFDEYVHGYDDDTNMWAVLPPPVHAAAWIVCALVVLALIGANVPFAPPIPAQPPDERDSSAYLDAMAALMLRSRG